MKHIIHAQRVILACIALSGLVAVHESKAQAIPGWGKVTDPAGDCKVVEKDGGVAITVPGTYHDLFPLPGYENVLAPRVLQKVAGDFQLQVKVQAFPRPEANTSSAKQPNSYVAAGLLVWQDDKTFIRCQRAANGERGDIFLHVVAVKDGKQMPVKLVASTRNLPDEATTLRVERAGDEFTLSVSGADTKWAPIFSLSNFTLSAAAQVGVAVVNATTKVVTAQFEELKLRSK